MKLSEKRAEAVEQALINVHKVLPDKLSTDGKGYQSLLHTIGPSKAEAKTVAASLSNYKQKFII